MQCRVCGGLVTEYTMEIRFIFVKGVRHTSGDFYKMSCGCEFIGADTDFADPDNEESNEVVMTTIDGVEILRWEDEYE